MGQRWKSLELIQKAAALVRGLPLPDERSTAMLAEMRNEAIAALALPDLRVAKEIETPNLGPARFDAQFQRCLFAVDLEKAERRRLSDAAILCRGIPSKPNFLASLSPDGRFAVPFSGPFRLLRVDEPAPRIP